MGGKGPVRSFQRLLVGLVAFIGIGLQAATAGGVYRLVESQKHGAEGRDYEQWSALQRENLAQQPGYVPHGHSWSVGPGEGRISILRWRFDPSCPECEQQVHSYEGRHEVPQTLPAGGRIAIPLSIRASISNWPAGHPLGMAGALEFSWWTSADRVDWRFVSQKAFYSDEMSGLLDARWETEVPDGPRWLILDTSHSNAFLGGIGMRHLYELAPAAPASPPPPAQPEPPAAPAPTAPGRQVVFFGEVTGVSGEALPHVRLIVTASFAGAQTVAADASGFFTWRAPLPAGTESFTLAAEVELAADREGQTLFEVRESAEARLVRAGSLIRMQLGPEDANRSEIAIARQLEFKRLAQGWFSADAQGRPDGYLETTSRDRATGYSDVYRQLWAGWATAEQLFGEGKALLARAPLRAWVDAGGHTRFNGDDGTPDMLLAPADSGHDDGARYAVLHEFGHYFDWATNGGRHRCDYDAHIARDHVPHRGYLNPSTAESFVEGFATWFVGEVRRHGPYAQPDRAHLIAEQGSLREPRRAYDLGLTSEELAIASVLHRLSANDPGATWAALRPDRPHLQAYHAALRAAPPAGFDGPAVDRLFVEFGLYRQPYGNGEYDSWEPFLDDAPANGSFDPGERWGDLRYAEMERVGLLRELQPGESLAPGQSADAAWTRDPARERHSTAVEPGRRLAFEGELPSAVRVHSEPDGGTASAYVIALEDGHAPVAVPAGAGDGTLRVSIPGGRMVWIGRYSEVRARLRTPAGRVGPLAQVVVRAIDHPQSAVLPVAVDGDPAGNPVREIGPFQDAREPWPAELPPRAGATGGAALDAGLEAQDGRNTGGGSWSRMAVAVVLVVAALALRKAILRRRRPPG